MKTIRPIIGLWCGAGLILAGLAAAVSAESVGERGCLGLDLLSESALEEQRLAFLATVDDEAGLLHRLACSRGSVERLQLRAEPGQQARVGLLLANPGPDPVLISRDMTRDAAWASDWVYLELPGAEIQPGSFLPATLVITVPDDYSPGERFEHRFGLLEGSEKLELSVALEVIREQPMFRDDFEVDPVIGQFSQYSGHSDSETVSPGG
ncbi:hypothetical protein IC757_09830 [Wenzhouxiangella sp. AB-CW3]|uniref:hypothetical protein n=1 Tax=Wenzhouxiangella sp. AB-CW3 TaxID=2771012 RepID=UPI00168BA134|nr:hypothetical protein [Wenzhouxiangella sp. AB-CW3]QOC21354.1 hypothetical protein IC757_09830 [Wenzhouxiangella sp. AB-CW3]